MYRVNVDYHAFGERLMDTRHEIHRIEAQILQLDPDYQTYNTFY